MKDLPTNGQAPPYPTESYSWRRLAFNHILLVASFKKTSSRKDGNQIRCTNREKLKGNKMQRTDENFVEIHEYYHRDWRKYRIYENKNKTLMNIQRTTEKVHRN